MNALRRTSLIALALMLALAATESRAGGPDDRETIKNLLKHTFDKPHSPLNVSPITLGEGYAVAGWTQGARGGRALLKKSGGKWSLQACGGDGLKEADMLERSGLSHDAAARLATDIAQAEKQLPAVEVQKFSLFREDSQPPNPAMGSRP